MDINGSTSNHRYTHKVIVNNYHLCDVEFPFEPYKPQKLIIDKIVETLSSPNQNALIESPTGTGKTLAFLCSALGWQHSIKNGLITHFKKKFIDVDDKGKSSNELSTQELDHFSMYLPVVPGASSLPNDSFKNVRIEKIKKYIESGNLGKARENIVNFYRSYRTIEKTQESSDESSGELNMNFFDNNEGNMYPVVPRIYYATRTHSQITQVVRELKKTTYKPNMCILASREHFCIHETVKNSDKKNEDCKDLVRNKSCIYYRQVNHLIDAEEMKDDGEYHLFDIEDFVEIAKRKRGCPYYTSHKIFENADIVFCPYNYLIDPLVRSGLPINFQNSIIIFDEAHNIEDISRKSVSCELATNSELKETINQLNLLVRNRMLPIVHNDLSELLNRLLIFTNQATLGFKQDKTKKSYIHPTNQHMNFLRDVLEIDTDKTRNEFFLTFRTFFKYCFETQKRKNDKEAMDEHLSMLPSKGIKILEKIFNVSRCLVTEKKKFLNDYRICVTQETTTNKRRFGQNTFRSETTSERKLNIWCMNPAVGFHFIKKENVKNIILTSGTLSPMESFERELNIDFKMRLEAPHVIDCDKQIWAGIVSNLDKTNSSYVNHTLNGSYRENIKEGYQDHLGDTIFQMCKIIPKGTLVFFPSYSFMKRMKTRWEKTGLLKKIKNIKHVHFEPQKTSNKKFVSFIQKYYEQARSDSSSKNGAVLFAVCRGRISEGIDFKDDLARAVLIVGIPFPSTADLEIVLKREYNDLQSKFKKMFSGSQWYTTQAFRALNQAVGRCIRHSNDFGAMIFLDQRFEWKQNLSQISTWVRNSTKSYFSGQLSLNSLSKFYSEVQGNIELKNKDQIDIMQDKGKMKDEIDYDGSSTEEEDNIIDLVKDSDEPIQKKDNIRVLEHFEATQKFQTPAQPSSSKDKNNIIIELDNEDEKKHFDASSIDINMLDSSSDESIDLMDELSDEEEEVVLLDSQKKSVKVEKRQNTHVDTQMNSQVRNVSQLNLKEKLNFSREQLFENISKIRANEGILCKKCKTCIVSYPISSKVDQSKMNNYVEISPFIQDSIRLSNSTTSNWCLVDSSRFDLNNETLENKLIVSTNRDILNSDIRLEELFMKYQIPLSSERLNNDPIEFWSSKDKRVYRILLCKSCISKKNTNLDIIGYKVVFDANEQNNEGLDVIFFNIETNTSSSTNTPKSSISFSQRKRPDFSPNRLKDKVSSSCSSSSVVGSSSQPNNFVRGSELLKRKFTPENKEKKSLYKLKFKRKK